MDDRENQAGPVMNGQEYQKVKAEMEQAVAQQRKRETEARAKLHPRELADVARRVNEFARAAWVAGDHSLARVLEAARESLTDGVGIAFVQKYGIE